MSVALALLAFVSGASAQIYGDLHDFNSADGANPSDPQVLAEGRDGNLYGTTPGGGQGGGVVFRITPAGLQTVLYTFTGSDGYVPNAGLTLGLDGNFYGTTILGGVHSLGAIYKITAGGGLTVLYSFTGGSDGAYPYATPVLGNDGNLYGVTQSATAYKITPLGTFTVLGTLPSRSFAPLFLGADGDFYGTTQHGGTFNQGTVFRMTPAGKITVIYSFDGTTHGGVPWGGVVQAAGNFYGTTTAGGSGGGVVYRLTPTGSLTVIHNFPVGSQTDGSDPIAGLLFASNGFFYGTTFSGGSGGYGDLFQINANGQSYVDIYDFQNTFGSNPSSNLVQHTNGFVYGMATHGGLNGDGVLFSLALNLGATVKPVLSSGRVGGTVEVLGSGFLAVTGITFGGIAASPTSIKVISDTYLTVAVPPGARNGPLTVYTSTGSMSSMTPFTVLPPIPKITTFNPTSGPVGTSVTITGSGFTGASKVTFGGISATSFTVDSDIQVTAIVPTGAQTGKIGITTAGGLATSSGIFTVTP